MKKTFFLLLHRLGLTRLAAWWNRRRVVFLCYHGVTERASRHSFDPAGLHIRADRFETQLDYLQRHYRVISLGEFLKARENDLTLPDCSVVLTFDDGYRNFLTSAMPKLATREMPVSIFLITDCIETEDKSRDTAWSESDDQTFLSWSEVKELLHHGVEIGSHTCTHPKLSELSPSEAERELRRSYEVIAGHLTQPTIPFAFPYGSYSPSVIDMTRAVPYTCALTTDAGTNSTETDLFLLRRNLIGDDDDEALFAARVSGLMTLFQKATKRHKKYQA